jgi:hypothetical protein
MKFWSKIHIKNVHFYWLLSAKKSTVFSILFWLLNMSFLRFSLPFNGEVSAQRGYNSKRTLATPLCDLAKEVGTEQPSIFELG